MGMRNCGTQIVKTNSSAYSLITAESQLTSVTRAAICHTSRICDYIFEFEYANSTEYLRMQILCVFTYANSTLIRIREHVSEFAHASTLMNSHMRLYKCIRICEYTYEFACVNTVLNLHVEIHFRIRMCELRIPFEFACVNSIEFAYVNSM